MKTRFWIIALIAEVIAVGFVYHGWGHGDASSIIWGMGFGIVSLIFMLVGELYEA